MKVSFVVPVFNADAYLDLAVASIDDNRCDGVDIEIILVDDCSTSADTVARLATLAARPGVTLVRHAVNGGPAAARNTGIATARGDWIAFLDADDLLAPGTMALRQGLVQARPELRWLAGDMLEMRRIDELTHCHAYAVGPRNATLVAPGCYLLPRPTAELVAWSSLPVLGSMMVHRSVIDAIGPFDPKMIYGEDIFFCLVASTYADLYWVEQPCLYLRRHHESMMKNVLRLARESPRYTGRLVAEPRLKAIRKQLRWQHAAALRQSSKVFLAHRLRLAALKSALLSILWTPNDMNSLRSIARACFGKAGA